MTRRVIDDIRDYIDNDFHIDDIVQIYAVKFDSAFSDDILRIITSSRQSFPAIIKTEIGLYDERPKGTHAYNITLLDHDFWDIPIW